MYYFVYPEHIFYLEHFLMTKIIFTPCGTLQYICHNKGSIVYYMIAISYFGHPSTGIRNVRSRWIINKIPIKLHSIQ